MMFFSYDMIVHDAVRRHFAYLRAHSSPLDRLINAPLEEAWIPLGWLLPRLSDGENSFEKLKLTPQRLS